MCDKNLCRGPGSHRRSDAVNSVGKCERELRCIVFIHRNKTETFVIITEVWNFR